MKNMKKIIISVMTLMLIAVLCSCSAGMRYDKMSNSEMAPRAESVSESYDYGNGYDYGVYDEESVSKSLNPEEVENKIADGGQQASDPLLDQKLIKRANITLESLEFEKTVFMLEAKTKELGGYIENSSTDSWTSYNNNQKIYSAYYVLRIPSSKYEAFLTSTESFGNITNISREAVNITSEYRDVETRLKSIKTEHTRLLELLEKADSLKTIVEINQRLAEVEYQIDSMTSRLKNWDGQVDYSFITIRVEQVETFTETVEPIKETFGGNIVKTFNGMTKTVLTIFEYLTYFIVALIPLWIIIAIALTIVIVIRKRNKKKNMEEK